jgi:type II secretory pathway component PulF
MFSFRTRMLMLFYRELAQLTGSGVAITEAMDILSKQQGYPHLNRAISGIKQEIDAGATLGEAFSRYPDIFPKLHVGIIKYSEASGRLAQGIGNLADYLEKEYAMQQSLVVGLAYPVILLHIAMFLLPLVNSFGCRQTAYIIGFLNIFIPVYGLVFLVYLVFRMRKNEEFKTVLDGFILGIPVIGKLVRQFALTRFVRALQVLSASGVGITIGWKMAGESCGNNVVRDAVLKGMAVLGQGQSISQAFIQSGVFPASMIGLITAAEKSGSIVQTLNTIASYSEKDNETAVAVLTRIVPVVVYLLIAAFIGLRIISFYLGYFNQIFSISG